MFLISRVIRHIETQKKGQATVEYILMLSSIVVVVSAFLMSFHTRLARFFFDFVGMLISS